jgi:hypothetical protein
MSRSLVRVQRMLALLSLCGATFSLFAGGCYYPTFADYTTLLQASGDAVIQTVSDNVFGNIGTDYDAIIRLPTTAFSQAVWGNYVDAHIPDDLPNNTIVLR